MSNKTYKTTLFLTPKSNPELFALFPGAGLIIGLTYQLKRGKFTNIKASITARIEKTRRIPVNLPISLALLTTEPEIFLADLHEENLKLEQQAEELF